MSKADGSVTIGLDAACVRGALSGRERVVDPQTCSLGLVGWGVVGSTIGTHAIGRGFDVMACDPILSNSASLADVASRDFVFIAVPTPGLTAGPLDMSAVRSVVESLSALQTRATLILKSTLYPGTFESLRALHPKARLAYVPEFLRASHRQHDFAHPDRTIIAADDVDVRDAVVGLYEALLDAPHIVTTAPRIAELVKLTANSFLALKVSFANELHDACAKHGVDWGEVADLVARDTRIGPSHFTVTPERGFGGACLPKDTQALASWISEQDASADVLLATLRVNERVRTAAVNGSRVSGRSRLAERT